jgi:hypothetical protein
MSDSLKYKIFDSEGCISEKTMYDYIDGKLAPKEQHLVEKHLLDCDMCSDALEGLQLKHDRGKIEVINSEIRKRVATDRKKIVPFKYTTIVSIAAGLALLVIGVFLFNSIKKEDLQQPELAEKTTAPVVLDSSRTPAEISTGFSKKEEVEKSLEDRSGSSKDVNVAKEEPSRWSSGEVAEESIEDVPAQPQVDLDENQAKVADLEQAPASKTPAPVVEGATEGYNTNFTPPSTVTNSNSGLSTTTQYEYTVSEKKASEKSNKSLKLQKAKRASEAREENNKNVLVFSSPGKKDEVDKSKETSAVTIDNQMPYAPDNLAGNTSGKVSSNSSEMSKADSLSLNDDVTLLSVLREAEANESLPQFPGGDSAMVNFINKNFLLPANYRASNTPVRIYASFTVTSTGEIKDISIVKSSAKELNMEATRVIKAMPKWKPAQQQGKAVSEKVTIKISPSKGN